MIFFAFLYYLWDGKWAGFIFNYTHWLIIISYLFARLFYETITLKITYWYNSGEGRFLRPHHRLCAWTTALDCMLPEAASETGIQVQIGDHLASDLRKHQ